MAQKLAQLRIINGPSKFDLMVSLLYGRCSGSSQQKSVKFELVPSEKPEFFTSGSGKNALELLYTEGRRLLAPARITGLQRENGSGESWSFSGNCGQSRIEGYFSTRDRHGYISQVK